MKTDSGEHLIARLSGGDRRSVGDADTMTREEVIALQLTTGGAAVRARCRLLLETYPPLDAR